MNSNGKLLECVVGMLSSCADSENVYKMKIAKKQSFKGKTRVNYVDIYLEFEQMNNIERTVINVIDSRTVVENDIIELDYTINDLEFAACGILYYNEDIVPSAINMADNRIKLAKFNLLEEISKTLQKRVGILLPDENNIGDPFWVVMEANNDFQNTGNYCTIEGKIIPLYFSQKQARFFSDKSKGNTIVCGLTQHHLKILCKLSDFGKISLGIVTIGFGVISTVYEPGNENIIKWYYRRDLIE